MRNTLAGLAIAVALLHSSVAGVCQSAQDQSEIRFRLVHDTVIVVSLTADNEGPFAFVLDTGADTTIVDPSLASTLSLVSQRRVRQTTLAGIQTLTVSSMATLAAGPARVNNLPVLIQDLSELRRMDPHIEGIVGQDFLSHFNYLLEYRRHSIRIEQSDEIKDAIEGEPVPVEAGKSRMIVSAEAGSDRHAKLRLLLDSGASSVVLMGSASRALHLPVSGKGLEVTSSGHVGLQVGKAQTLMVGSQQFHDVTVALSDAEPAERIGDGLLPMVLFRVVYVNNREGFVVFNPRIGKIRLVQVGQSQ